MALDDDNDYAEGGKALPTAFLVGSGVRPDDDAEVADRLRALGFDVMAEPGPHLAQAVGAAPAGRVALVDRRWAGHEHALRLATADSRHAAVAITGALSVDDRARAQLEAALREGGPAPGWDRSTRTNATVDSVADALRTRTPVHVLDPSPLVAAVPRDAAERQDVRSAVAGVDEEDIRLRLAVKDRDGFFTTHLVSPWSRYVARWCARRGLTPNQVTLASLLVALLAAGLCATGTRPGYVAGAVLLQVSFVLDCVDGQLARYALRFSRNGGWLDALCDRGKEYAVLAGLAWGSSRSGDPVWTLAAAAMAFQTVRHFLHFGYTEATRGRVQDSATTPVWARVNEVASWSVWLRRTAVLPIGERWALISLAAALTTPRIVFVLLLVTGGLAFCYAGTGRVLRSLHRSSGWGATAARALDPLLDLGPLARPVAVAARRARRALSPGAAPAVAAIAAAPLVLALLALAPDRAWWLVAATAWYAAGIGLAASRPLTGRLDWLLPAVARAAEYATVITVAAVLAPAALPAAFALVAASAYRHYDLVYRLRERGLLDRVVGVVTGGHEGRMVLVAVLAALAPDALGRWLAALALACAAANLAASVRWWLARPAIAAPARSGPAPQTAGGAL